VSAMQLRRLMNIEQSLAPKVQCLSRDELYGHVWQTSLTQLGTELGISNNGLAQSAAACRCLIGLADIGQRKRPAKPSPLKVFRRGRHTFQLRWKSVLLLRALNFPQRFKLHSPRQRLQPKP
jgi:hypothetical protein